MEYFVKVHPAAIILLPYDKEPLVFKNTGDIYQAVKQCVNSINDPSLFIFEKPYINAQQNPMQIIATQRAYGALLYTLHSQHPSAPIREFSATEVRKIVLPETPKPSKDHRLTLINAKYHTLQKQYTPVEELGIFDAYILQEYYRKIKNGANP